MSGKKKNGNQKDPTKVFILITAILNLIKSLCDLIAKLLD